MVNHNTSLARNWKNYNFTTRSLGDGKSEEKGVSSYAPKKRPKIDLTGCLENDHSQCASIKNIVFIDWIIGYWYDAQFLRITKTNKIKINEGTDSKFNSQVNRQLK